MRLSKRTVAVSTVVLSVVGGTAYAYTTLVGTGTGTGSVAAATGTIELSATFTGADSLFDESTADLKADVTAKNTDPKHSAKVLLATQTSGGATNPLTITVTKDGDEASWSDSNATGGTTSGTCASLLTATTIPQARTLVAVGATTTVVGQVALTSSATVDNADTSACNGSTITITGLKSS